MALHVHRAERTDLLADGLGALLAAPLDDPFEQEVVVVPARGVERWLTQRLSHRLGTGARGGDGVCAGVRFLSPHSLVSMLLGRELDDPWEPDRLAWPLLEVIDDSLGAPWCATLAAHLGHGIAGEEGELRSSRRYAVAHRLAGLYSSYARQRVDLVRAWRLGDDTDGLEPLPEDLAWQAELWRRLVSRVGEPPPDVRHEQTLAALAAGGTGLDLPGRLSLFGHTRLPATEVELLGALGEHRDVHLWLPQASAALWADLAGPSTEGPVPRDDDRSSTYAGHPLLASLGRDARELQRSLAVLPGAVDAPSLGAVPAGDDLLGHLQADIRANHAPTPVELSGRALAEDDRSVQVHACHGPARQVEVLREVLVGLLQDDPTLEPRDIVVMCPDVETYAPLIEAGFGLADVVPAAAGAGGHPAHHLRVRLADRALSSTNPLFAVALSLVSLAAGRARASEVLDLIGLDVCRRRFGLDDDDLTRVAGWVSESGVRWGLDGWQRARFKMEAFRQNTWRAGLDRVLTGVALSGDEHVHLGVALPLDDVGSSDVELAGRLAEFVDRLESCLQRLDAAATVPDWLGALGDGVRGLARVPEADMWQQAQFDRELSRTLHASGQGAGSTRLRLADVRALLTARLAGRPTRSNFRTGTLTVCTMVPMRSVPHRVVCLVGLDDGVFPRSQWIDGDDVLARRPLTGERDRRSEDRQLLLDAIMSATERLVVCYTGANEHTGAVRPPAVPLGELLDTLDRTAPGDVRERVLTRHPLQAYDTANLTDEGVGRGRPFSFDPAALAGARSAVGERTPRAPFLPGPLPPREPEDLSLDDLHRFLAHPVRHFCRERLGIGTPLEAPEDKDAMPVELDSLEAWAIGDRLLADLVAGVDMEQAFLAEQLRGSLPPQSLGVGALTGAVTQVQQLWNSSASLREGEPRAVDVIVDLGDGRRLTGTVSGVHGHRAVRMGYSRVGAKQRLASWLDLLALSAAHPDQHWAAVTIGRARGKAVCAVSGPLDHRAAAWLRELVTLRDEGLTRPLPLPVKTSLAYQDAVSSGRDEPREAAAKEWETDPNNSFGIEGEDADPWHTLVHGGRAPLEDLIDAGLPAYAERLWAPLLAVAPKVRPL